MKRILDWKFFIALGFALLSCYLAFSGYAAIEDGREKDRQNAALIRTIETKDANAERDRAAAAADRETAAANQASLLAYTKALADRQSALLGWLRRNGIDLPTRYLTEITPPTIVRDSAPKSTKKRTERRPADLPGKSERGQRKGKGKR